MRLTQKKRNAILMGLTSSQREERRKGRSHSAYKKYQAVSEFCVNERAFITSAESHVIELGISFAMKKGLTDPVSILDWIESNDQEIEQMVLTIQSSY